MRRWIGAIILAVLISGGSATIDSAAAVSPQAAVQKPAASQAMDFSARPGVARRGVHRHVYRRYDRPHYYDRPETYRPYPYVLPAPFPFGLGFGPWW
jgi:hypothetical protein